MRLRADVSRETSAKLDRLCELVRTAADLQNLVASSTLADLEHRHIEDSLQLIRWIPPDATGVLDVGSGAGFPGLVLAIASGLPTILVEPRPLRADFLRSAVSALDLVNTEVRKAKVEQVRGSTDVISARAVASLDRLFAMTWHLAHESTVWILPKGRTVKSELAVARRTWQGEFEIRPSMTDPEAGIVIARKVRRKQPT